MIDEDKKETNWVDSKWENNGKTYERKKRVYQKTKRNGMPVQKGLGRRRVRGNWKQIDWDSLLERFANGELLTRICKENTVPSRDAVYHRIRTNEEFKRAYEIARELHCDKKAEEIEEIADDRKEDFTLNERGERVYHSAVINRDKLRIETRQWRASKLEPKKYGAKIEQNISGDLTTVQPIINLITGVDVDEREGGDQSKITSEAKPSLTIESD